MLASLDLTDGLAAATLLSLQRTAYQTEADLLHYPALPPLYESLPDLMDSGETVLVWRENGELVAAIGYTATLASVHICRLAVLPSHRRRGIAAKLVQAVIVAAGPRPITVDTAKQNLPGIALYAQLGFHQRNERATSDGLELVQLQRLAERAKPIVIAPGASQ